MRVEFGMVSSKSNQNGQQTYLMKEEEKMRKWLMLQRIFRLEEKILDKKKIRQTDQTMKNILMHAKTEWREQSAVAQVLDPKNKNSMKRRRAGVVFTKLG